MQLGVPDLPKPPAGTGRGKESNKDYFYSSRGRSLLASPEPGFHHQTVWSYFLRTLLLSAVAHVSPLSDREPLWE